MDFSKYRNYFLIIFALVVLYVLSSSAYNNKSSNLRIDYENFGSTRSMPQLKLYYANWCGWSKKFLPTWTELEKKVKNVKLIKIDCENESNKAQCQNIPGYPFLVLEKDGKKINYNGDRSYNDVSKFLNKNT
jgi:thiol-disulfide isomerase/thioredoxin